jgi:sugar-phosphatase
MAGIVFPWATPRWEPAQNRFMIGSIKEFLCDGILFDLDGVLIDSTACVERHWTAWANKHGLDPHEVLKMAHGVRNIETMRRLAPNSDVEKEAADFASLEVADTAGIVAIDAAAAIMQSLEEGPWAVVTSCGGRLARARLRAAQVPLPPLLITGDDVGSGKPDPAPYLLAASRLGPPPEACVVVEDAPAGVEAGKRAGMRVVAIAATYAAQDLSAAGADIVVGQLTELEIRKAAGGEGLVVRFTQPQHSTA